MLSFIDIEEHPFIAAGIIVPLALVLGYVIVSVAFTLYPHVGGH